MPADAERQNADWFVAVVTGEEDEDTLHSVRCKLFVMSEGAWVERGTGVMKMNASKNEDHESGIPRLGASKSHQSSARY